MQRVGLRNRAMVERSSSNDSKHRSWSFFVPVVWWSHCPTRSPHMHAVSPPLAGVTCISRYVAQYCRPPWRLLGRDGNGCDNGRVPQTAKDQMSFIGLMLRGHWLCRTIGVSCLVSWKYWPRPTILRFNKIRDNIYFLYYLRGGWKQVSPLRED